MKIASEEIEQFERKYQAGMFPTQRYGQAFCNTFDITDDLLFYEEDWKIAASIAWVIYSK